MKTNKPYTYLIGWSKLGYWYYGCRYGKKCHPNDLWTTYFTSSKLVKEMRQYHGEPDVIKIRMVFNSGQQARRCEEKVLDKVGAVKSTNWLNIANRGKDFNSAKPGVGNNISKALRGKPKTEEQKRLQSRTMTGKKNPSEIKYKSGMISCYDAEGQFYRIPKEEFYIRDDLFGVRMGIKRKKGYKKCA